jgi:diaminopimelate epimerase
MLPSMRIDFTKMHGLGNDFFMLDLPADAPLPTSAQWRALADRHTGVGFDQALVLQPARRVGTDAFSTPMAVRSSYPAMARAASRRCCTSAAATAAIR